MNLDTKILISLVVVLLAVFAAVSYETKIKNDAIVEMVKNGADPIAAMVSVKGGL